MSKKQYKVLKPIGYLGDRIESGAIIEMPEADALNIGLDYVTPVEIETVEAVEEENEVIAETEENVEAEAIEDEQAETEEETVEAVEEEVKVSSKSKRGKK